MVDMEGWAGKTGKTGWETDYVVSRYPTPPHTIHPPHQIATIFEKSVIVPWRLWIPSNNIVTTWYRLKLTHCYMQLEHEYQYLRPNPDEETGLW